MRALKSGQINERVYAGMAPANNGRFEQAHSAHPRAVQQILKFLQGGRIGGQLPISSVYSTVRLSPVMPNGTFRPGHEVLQFSKPLSERHQGGAVTTQKQRGLDCRSRPACFRFGLDKKEEHRTFMIEHALHHRHVNPGAASSCVLSEYASSHFLNPS